MTNRVQWHQPGSKIYEDGLDRGMLYVQGEVGVPWNGLLSVDETWDHEVNPVYFDGLKANDIVTYGSFAGVIRAFTYPDEFLPCEGVYEDQQGLFVSDQNLKRFSISYRTLVTDPVTAEETYKIHLLYNLTAVPSTVTRETLGLTPNPKRFEWNVTSIPESLEGYRPTSHIVLDQRQIDPLLWSDLEDLLYGSEDDIPSIPPLQGLVNFIRKWERLIIIDNGDGTWTAIAQTEGVIRMVSETEFEIDADNVVWHDPPNNTTYDISSSDKNKEDL